MSKVLMNHKLLGVVFIGLIVLGLWAVNGVFTQRFTSFDKVTLTSSTIGLNLPERADVKVRGVIVGQVLDFTPTKDGKRVNLELGIYSDKMKQVPANVTGSLIPKTLFGEKYVSLDVPKNPSTRRLQPGAHIAQTRMPIEVSKVLADLYPVLRTLRPEQISYTLNAIATALEGRGEKIGRSFGTLQSFLSRLDPKLPQLISDLRLLSKVSSTYADVMPQVAATLRNTVVTGRTLVSRQAKLHQFLRDTAGFSDTTKRFLDANGRNIIRLGQLTEPQLALLRRYSPEYPCLLRGLVRQIPREASTFRGYIFHIRLVLLKRQPPGYGPGDGQVYGDSRGPGCGGLPSPSGSASHPYQSPNFNDGTNKHGRPAPSFAGGAGGGAASPSGLTITDGGTRAQRDLVSALTAPALRVPVDRVPDVTTLMFTPMAAGGEVSLR